MLIHILVENLERNNFENCSELGRESVGFVNVVQRRGVNFHFQDG